MKSGTVRGRASEHFPVCAGDDKKRSADSSIRADAVLDGPALFRIEALQVLIGSFSQHESPHVIRDSADSQGLATANVRSFPLSGKRVVRDWPALICADTIRSFRTK
ncbi:hypothetical protein IVA95_16370 [Bradyrhizobium sp. 157]|uniref:hypothetical protein n=1 Tax=Bradyrhizobium sp. 157 TaxID=2782631 RepID=UPI001FFB69E2|nr:hypothetical protein [Bradyrhizobium sp. 157]MCK1639134.1 hypothetical protein [Bradyrhizobium sp. 157]